LKRATSIVFLLWALAACSAQKPVDPALVRLERSDAALKAEHERLLRRVEDLSNNVMVLQDRLETLKLAAERSHAPAPPARTAAPPAKPARETKPAAAPRPAPDADEEPFLIRSDPREASLPAIRLSNRDLEKHEIASASTSVRKPEASDLGAPVKAEANADNPEASRAYNDAFRKFEAGTYPDAIAAFEAFAINFHEHPYADNAVFWVGESYFQMKDYARSAAQFERVARQFPGGNKVPDALLRAADCYLRLDRPKDAMQVFERVIDTYPQSVAAGKARAWLTEYSAQSGKGRM
jgi:tol-pal system protein YbgF